MNYKEYRTKHRLAQYDKNTIRRIEAAILKCVEDSELDEDQIVERVSEMFSIDSKEDIARIMSNMDF